MAEGAGNKAQVIDARWRAANPLPDLGSGLDKEERGRALIIGGSTFVPGALLLTGEALLRTGAGKVQLAIVDPVAVPLGVQFPEAAVVALPTDEEGEIAAHALETLRRPAEACGALLFGPGMRARPHTAALVEAVLAAVGQDVPILLDAGAMTALKDRPDALEAVRGRCVLTPHHGELAALTGIDKEEIDRDPEKAAVDTAERFGIVVALKDEETIIAGGDGPPLRYVSGAPGIGTAGSGDVLAGVVGGLLARGLDPVRAAGWGVWLHGEAGRAAGGAIAPFGYLARDLLRHIPALMAKP